MSRYYKKLPENFDQMSDQEIEAWAERLWFKIASDHNVIDRNTQLELRQKAYAIWREKYPEENDDDSDCHLEDIYSSLLSEYLKPDS